MFHGHLDYFQKPPLEGRPNTKPGHHSIPNAHNCWFILFYHDWGPVWIKIHWNGIWLRARSHMTSHHSWGSATTIHDFGGVLEQPLDTFFWALTISWSRLLACVCDVTLKLCTLVQCLEENFGHNWLKSYCFHVQLVIYKLWSFDFSLYNSEVYSIHLS